MTKRLDTIDLHGVKLKAAQDLFTHLLNKSRLQNETYYVPFITGQGEILGLFIDLAELHQLDYWKDTPGMIFITFE